MIIFGLRPDVEAYQWLTFPRENDFLVSQELRGTPVRDRWEVLSVTPLKDDLSDNALSGDFPTLGTIPVFSERAVNSLRDLLEANGEILPLTSADGSYSAYNVTTVVDALDEVRSKVTRFRDGRVMEILEYAFLPQRLGGLTIFKVPQILSNVFVTDVFVSRVREAGLVGFKFNRVWAEPDYG